LHHYYESAVSASPDQLFAVVDCLLVAKIRHSNCHQRRK